MMCSIWMKEVISARKIFTLICSAFTLFLISKLLFTFTVTKPTTTYKEEKELETTDLPEIVVCSEPGFKLEALKKYGYKRGINNYFGDIGKFTGWNGGVGVQKSSQEILEESLIFESQTIGEREKYKVGGLCKHALGECHSFNDQSEDTGLSTWPLYHLQPFHSR